MAQEPEQNEQRGTPPEGKPLKRIGVTAAYQSLIEYLQRKRQTEQHEDEYVKRKRARQARFGAGHHWGGSQPPKRLRAKRKVRRKMADESRRRNRRAS